MSTWRPDVDFWRGKAYHQAIRQMMKKAFLTLVGVSALVLVGASVVGHPIYGRPVMTDNRPLLEKPRLIGHLEAPNIVVTSTGERLTVEGVVFEEWVIAASPKELGKFFYDIDPLRITPDPRQPGKIAFEWKIHYFCGISFERRFFPRPLPRYRVADLGEGLISRNLAREAR